MTGLWEGGGGGIKNKLEAEMGGYNLSCATKKNRGARVKYNLNHFDPLRWCYHDGGR